MIQLTSDRPDRMDCPCCRYPTLTSRGAYELCPICYWEDDGQDDPHADQMWGGPNQDYSLTEARQNFIVHGIMYAPGRDKRLFGDAPGEHELRRQLVATFDTLRTTTDLEIRRVLWSEVDEIERSLDAAVDAALADWERRNARANRT